MGSLRAEASFSTLDYYEVAYSQILSMQVRHGANVLITIMNDAC
ncbi:MAG TPA: hypothetical protein VNN25_01215 [Thermoanaerobaculia bacterium]|nr:hypothetical protein [Thermoanaerobaculia bacterium]